MGKLATYVILLAALAIACYSRSFANERCNIAYQCPDTSYKPVCGNDTVTYHNACYMVAATCSRVAVLYPGKCIGPDTPPACRQIPACDSIDQPVCGSNGVTYDNDCYFRAQTCGTGITVRRSGRCLAPTPRPPCDPNRACNLLLDPVCGSNGVTYANECFFEGQTCGTGIRIEHRGSCTTIPTPDV